MKFGRLSVLTAATILAGAAPATAARTELKIGTVQFPSNFHPAIESMVAKEYVLGFTSRRLVMYGMDLKLMCQLCTELPTVENGRIKTVKLPDGRDGRAVTFTIKPDARWGDGKPVTSKDFAFALELGLDPMSGVTNMNLFTRDIVRLDVVDDKNFTVIRSETLCNPAEFADLRPLPEHIERKRWEANKAEYRTRNSFDSETTNPGLYTGPYRIVSIDRGANIVLERNPHWSGKRPQFERIVIKSIENTAALEANLKSGEIDFIAAENGIQFDQAVAFQRRNQDRYDIEYKSVLMSEHLNVNQDDPWLKDLRIRQALLHAIDRGAISKQIFEGQQAVADTYTHPSDAMYDKNAARTYAYDKAKAIELLTAAGWGKVGPDGIRVNEQGERFSIELGTTAGNKTRELIQQVIQRNWRDVGIDTRLKSAPPRVVFGEILRKRQFPHTYLTAMISSPSNPPTTLFKENAIPSEANAWSGQNYGGYRSAAMEQAFDDMTAKCDAYKESWSQYQKVYSETLPLIPLFWRINTMVTPKWLHGLKQTGHQFATSHWVEDWTAD